MNSGELASLVEFSEVKAYRSLIRAAPPDSLAANGCRAVAVGSAVAVMAETVINSLNMNRVIGLGVAEPATEAMIEEIVGLYGGRSLSFGIEVGPAARPQELFTWLRARRIRRGPMTAIHYRTAEPIAPVDGSVSVRRATRAERETVATICCAVFNMPATAHLLISGVSEVPEWRQWIGYIGDQPVSAALSFVCDGVGWLGWDATLPEFRGKGAQRTLIAHRVSDAVAAGCAYVTSETAANTANRRDPSFENYRRLGFTLAYERATYLRLASSATPEPRDSGRAGQVTL